MASKFLQVFIGNARDENERQMQRIHDGHASLKEVLAFCKNYRIAGIGFLFLFAESEELHKYLFKSGRAFAHFLRRATDESKVTSRSRPFFDALAVLDMDGAKEIAVLSRTDRSELEYEEDFLYVRFLMTHFVLGGSAQEAEALLTRYEQVLDGASDPRLPLCRALLHRDQGQFNESFDLFLDETKRHYALLADREMILEEELETEGRLSTEALSLLILAERVGLQTESDYPMAPSLARARTAPRLPPDAWLTLD